MTLARMLAVALIASILVTSVPRTVWAGEGGESVQSIDLRLAIDRAAAQAADAVDASTTREARTAARARQGMGGGGGSMMMVWTIVGTVAGLATTYYLVKEMRKQTDKATAGQ